MYNSVILERQCLFHLNTILLAYRTIIVLKYTSIAVFKN